MGRLRLAIDAGHSKNTPGNRVPANMGVGNISKGELSDRIVIKRVNMLDDYQGVDVIRLDDVTGRTDVLL